MDDVSTIDSGMQTVEYHAKGAQAGVGVNTRMDEGLPPLGAIVRIWHDRLRMLGVSAHALVLATEAPPFHLYLVPDANGAPGLVSFGRWRELRAIGAAEVMTISPDPVERADEPATADERLSMTCGMLDAAHVPNGRKAIAIYLHQHWSEDLRRRFGEPDNPNTLRRWRVRRRAAPPG